MGHRKIRDVETIDRDERDALHAASVFDTRELLHRGRTAAGRRALAEEVGVSEQRVLAWVRRADLFRIHGVGPDYAELLESAGVDSIHELRRRRAPDLAARLAEVNRARRITRNLPPPMVVDGWIVQAQDLPKVVDP